MTATIQFANGKKGLEKVFIKSGTLMYTKVKTPVVIYAQKDLPSSAHTKFEYSTDIVVNEDVADLWDEQFPKQSAKKVLKAAFMKTYKIEKEEDFPESLDSSSKKFFVIKVKQGTHYDEYKDGKATGNILPFSAQLRPRAVAVIDGVKKDITITENIGNGSVGDVLLAVNHNKTYGDSAKLKGILVTDLVAYEASGGNEDLTDFFGDDVEFAELPEETKSSTSADGDDFTEDEEPPFDLEEESDFPEDY